QRLEVRRIARVFGTERIEHVLALACGVHAPLDSDLLDQLLETKTGGDDADRPDNRIFVRVDFIAGEQEHVAAGGRDVLGEGHDLHALFAGESADAIVDQRRLNGRAAGRVDDDRSRGDRLVGEEAGDRIDRAGQREAAAKTARHADSAGKAQNADD